MATITTGVVWGSGPKIYFDFSYSKQRSGTTQQYKITVECKKITSGSYFGYPIYLDITVNETLAATKTLKSASPSTWTSALTYTTDWISVANKTTGTTPLKIRIYSGSGSTRDITYSYSLAIDSAPSTVSATNANIGSNSTVKFTRYNSSFTHTLDYKADGQSSYTTIFSKKNLTSYNWTVPSTLYGSITSGKTVGVTLRCQTYNGSTLVGTNYCAMTATAVPSKITATNANVGSTSSVTFTRYGSAFTHTLSYIANGQNNYTTIFSKKNVTSYSWTVPASLCSLITSGKTISVTLQCQTYNGSTLVGTTTCTMTATAVPSSVGAADANIGSTSTVTFARDNSSFTHTLSYKAAGQNNYTTIFSKKNVTSYAWTVPTALYALIPKTKKIDVTLQCQTYNGSTLVGTTTCTMTATAEESKCGPSISVSAVDNNTNTVALTGSNKKIIRYHSDVEVTATATANTASSASISKTTLICGAKSASATTYTFIDAESATVSATTTDSRGYSKTATASGLSLVNYIKLTANTVVKRETPTGDTVTVTTTGNYFNDSFGAVTNTLTAEVRYKTQSQSEYTDNDLYSMMTVTISGNTYTATATLHGLDYRVPYDIRVRVQDAIYKYQGSLADAKYNEIKLGKGAPVFDWGDSDFRFNVPVRLIGDFYKSQDGFGLDANNSDIIGINGLYFCDNANDYDEGINFYRDGINWDHLYAYDGNLYFMPNTPSDTTAYKMFYAPGDTEVFSFPAPMAGFITSSTTKLHFVIPLSKPSIAKSVALSGKVNGRSINGYINGTSEGNSIIDLEGGTGYSVYTSITPTGVSVSITFDEAIENAVNNIPVAVSAYGQITLSFS